LKNKNRVLVILAIFLSISIVFFISYRYYSNYLTNKFLDNYTYFPSKDQTKLDDRFSNYKSLEWEREFIDTHEMMWYTKEKLYFINDTLIITHEKTRYYQDWIFPLSYLLKFIKYSSSYNRLHILKNDSLFLISPNGVLFNEGILTHKNGKLVRSEEIKATRYKVKN
jgi:hypothetical protein